MLIKAFNKQFEGIIWKIRPDEAAAHLVMEIRDPGRKEAFFSCIDTVSGNSTFNGLNLQEPWFCGLEGVAHGHAFLHGYLSETLPEHRGVFACRLENGQIDWEDYNLIFSHAAAEGIIAWNYKSEPRRYQLIDPESGQAVRAFASAEELEQGTSRLPAAPLYFPEKISLGKDWLEKLPSETLPEADLLFHDNLQVLAFYTRSGNKKMDHHIYAMDRNMELVHKDLLAEDILQPAMDTFFVVGNQLCYIKRKSEILAYFL